MAQIELSRDFIESYPEFPAHQDAIGKFTYLRTYSRYLASKGRREVLRETVERATRYSINLERKFREEKGLPINDEVMEAELKKLFHNVVNLKQWLSGRTMWVGGADTGVADKYPSANFNCSFTLVENYEDMVEAFYLLMVGVGVGFKSVEETCEQLPPIRNNFEIKHLPYNGVPKNRRSDDTYLKHINGHTIRIRVGDSKEGWVEAERQFFKLISTPEYAHITVIEFDYNWVRPRGERLNTFGGTASGHEPLAEMFSGFRRVIRNEIEDGAELLEEVKPNWVKLRPIHVIDMMNLTGYNVVVGGVRRTSEIALISAKNWEAIFAKYGINGIWGDEGFEKHEYLRKRMLELGIPVPHFWDELSEKWYLVLKPGIFEATKDSILFKSQNPEEAKAFAESIGITDYFPFPCNVERKLRIDHRRMSNNSIGFIDQPSEDFMTFLLEMQQSEGEPGAVNLYQLAKRRLIAAGNLCPTDSEIRALAYWLGVNPCGEIDLFSKGVCNLTTLNTLAFVQDGTLDLMGIIEAQRLSARAGVRMTLVTLELPKWHERQQTDRLLGVSLTGWKAAMGALSYDEHKEAALLELLQKVAVEAADEYCDELGINRSLLKTTVKPEGTGTLVLGAGSSGLHYPKIRKGIRRIRINSNDPMAKACMEHEGWIINPETNTPGATHEERLANARTLVIDFPMKSDSKLTEQDVNVYDQFNSYLRFQRHYTQHNSSNTIVLEPHEWAVAAKLIYQHWDEYVGISFLAKSGGSYQLAPYEQNPEAYEALVPVMQPFDMELLRKYEVGGDTDLDDDPDCATGACPVR
jgi:ribonucleoside-diphosphate reductase alpha chain/ribonucleoside-triphosphate reductase